MKKSSRITRSGSTTQNGDVESKEESGEGDPSVGGDDDEVRIFGIKQGDGGLVRGVLGHISGLVTQNTVN